MIKKIFLQFLLVQAALIAISQTDKQAIDKYIQALKQNQQFSGSVLIIEKDQVIYENTFGFADYTSGKKNRNNTRFPIASISKLFTATAILQLYEKGLIHLEEPVSTYLPDFPYQKVTIQHLLSHTSGLPPYNAYFDKIKNSDPKRIIKNKDFLLGVIKNYQPLIYQPGEKGNYDNINFIVLALIIEKVGKTSYEKFVRNHILKPAGMNETEFIPLPEQFNRKTIENFSYPHIYVHPYDTVPIKSNSIKYVREYWHSYAFNGFGDYVSTTRDLGKFDKALYNNILLKEETLQKAFTPVSLNNGQPNADLFGLGWEIEKDSLTGKMVYHSGAAMGLSSNILRNLNKHQTVIIFDNAHFNAHENAYNLMMILAGKKIDLPKKSIAKIYGKILFNRNKQEAKDTLLRLSGDTTNYYLSEDEMNSLGYDFLGNENPYRLPEKHYYDQAIETFRINTELFPTSWNAFDSYGEALLAAGRKTEAIKMYQKSLDLNPSNENGKKILMQIKGD